MPVTINTDLPSLTQLPDSFLIQLDNFSAISLEGEDQSKYLQGQVTCDVDCSDKSSLQHGAHCDAKGKVFSIFRFINRFSSHLLVQPKSSIQPSLKELKKFGVFSKVTIEETESLSFYALVGEQASTLLTQQFKQAPDSLTPVVQVGSTTLVYISGQYSRFILIDESAVISTIVDKFKLPIFQNKLWKLLEIDQGFPVLSSEHSGQYVPQMLNLQAINGISFTKGCYLGQETVARMQYLGKNKRALFSLIGLQKNPLGNDEILEKQLGENWRKAGDILTSYQADDGTCYIQAILSNNNDIETFRLKLHPKVLYTIKELPYSLTANEPS